jgi:carbamoyl-phosphate synthase small subunit
MSSTPGTALLVLEDGRVFRGEVFGATGTGLGEAVFCTGMTGYQETLTDPSYHRQIVVQTAPQIGNTGWNDEDDESDRIQVAGYAVRDPSRIASNWRSRRSLPDALRGQGVVGISGIDTRALVRHLRERGAMRAGVFSGDALAADAELVERVRASPGMAGADLYGAVTTREPYVVQASVAKRFTVAAIDVGIKSNTPRMLAARGIETHVLPADATIEQIEELGADGVFLSNGPGDPATADGPVALTRAVLERRIPLFGICFGNQILGRALGRGTYKMRYGHRGINIPVIELETGRVAITSQNHGFAVQGEAGERFDTPFGPALITHTCSNDGTVEGMRALEVPAFSVQYHPEAAAGPHDAADLFDRFVDMMAEATGRGRHRLYDPPPGVAPPVEEPDAAVGPAGESTPESITGPTPEPVAGPAAEDGAEPVAAVAPPVAGEPVVVEEPVVAGEPAQDEPADTLRLRPEPGPDGPPPAAPAPAGPAAPAAPAAGTVRPEPPAPVPGPMDPGWFGPMDTPGPAGPGDADAARNGGMR